MGRRLVASLLALFVLVEVGGAARAFRADGDVDCCCGEHSVVRRCHCNDCPVARRGQHARAGDQLDARSCDGGGGGDVVVLAVVAHALPSPPALVVTPQVTRSFIPPPLVRAGRLVEAGRPPP